MNINLDNNENQLFGSLSYQSAESLEKFMDSISLDQSIYLVKLALEFSHSRGIFNMNEAEILNKSLRIIDKNFLSDDESTTEE